MSKRLLLDNDIFLLLSGAGLLDETIGALGFTLAEARRLDALAHMLRKRARALSKYSEEILTRAADDCTRVAVIDEEPDGQMMELFTAHGAQVHGGEAVLLSLTASHETYLLGTNDKTALRAVASEPGLSALRERVAGRIVCLEIVMQRLIELLGTEELARRITPVLRFEPRLFAIFSPVQSGRPEDCPIAVESFLAGLRRELGEDFLWHP
jgi:hypothetical protein